MTDAIQAAARTPKVKKREFEALVPELRTALLHLQEDLMEAGFPVLIVLDGDDLAGCDGAFERLHEWLDARYLRSEAFGPPKPEDDAFPWMRRYWVATPPGGWIGVKPCLGSAAQVVVEEDLDDAGLIGVHAERPTECVTGLGAGRAVASVPLASLRNSRTRPSERAVRRALFTAALGFGLAPALVERPAEQPAATRRPGERKGTQPTSGPIPHDAGLPGTRRASRPGGSYPSAAGGQDVPYRSRR